MLNARCVGVKSCPSNGFGRKKKTDDCENSFLALLYDRESCTFVIGTGLSPAINRMADYVQHSDSAYFFFFRFHNLTDWWTAEGSPTLIIIKIKTASRSDNLSLFRKREKIITRWCMLKSSREILPVAILRKKNSNNSIPSCWTTIRLWNCCLTTNQQTAKR
jgi:hypothetical protein